MIVYLEEVPVSEDALEPCSAEVGFVELSLAKELLDFSTKTPR